MTKKEITDSLVFHHSNFTTFFQKLSDEDFIFSLNNEKWSSAQHADHIVRSLFPLKVIFGLPKWLSKRFFKKANRPSRSYDKLIERYLQKLEAGGRASGRFVPGPIRAERKAALARKIERLVSKLSKSVNKYSEHELDAFVMPHPLLGRITLREMLYFTIYHVQHHQRITLRDLALR